jgi:hypothetical protein
MHSGDVTKRIDHLLEFYPRLFLSQPKLFVINTEINLYTKARYFNNKGQVTCVHCHHGMARPQAVDGDSSFGFKYTE